MKLGHIFRGSFRLPARAILQDKLLKCFFGLNGVVGIAILLGIFIFLAFEGLQIFPEISWREFLFGKLWNPGAWDKPSWGILALLVGTGFILIGGLLLAVPLGIGSALYLSEVASSKIREILKPILEMLAALPSVVLGLFGLLVIAPLVAKIFGLPSGLNALTAAFLVGVMALPTITSIAEDVLKAVPRNYREASLALGGTPWQTLKLVFKIALPGVGAAIMLGMGRIIGETMVVLMVAGNALAFPETFFDPVRPLTSNIAIEIKEVVTGSLHYQALFATGLLLFCITFIINLLADIFIRKQAKPTQI